MAGGPLVAYIDGGAREDPEPAGCSIRVETADGVLVEELHDAILGVATNNTAEYRSLITALTFLNERGCRDPKIRSDSQLLTKQMTDESPVNNQELLPLYREATRLVARLGRVTFEHVPRSEHTETNQLANLAMNGGEADCSPAAVAATPAEPIDFAPDLISHGSIISIGIDCESISRVNDLLQRYGNRFLTRVFTDHEIAYSQRRRFPAQHLAGRFCAKEATMKALGTGRSLGVVWRDVEVQRVSGPPELRLHGGAATRFRQLSGVRSLVTITHTGNFAFAQVLLLKD
jgi:phosphopantetheine--protein transferase-like protein